MVSRTQRRARVILQVNVEETTAPMRAVDASQTVRGVPPTDADHPEVIRTPDGLPWRHVLRQVLQQAANNKHYHSQMTIRALWH